MGYKEGQHVNEDAGINLDRNSLREMALKALRTARYTLDPTMRKYAKDDARWYARQANYTIGQEQ